MSRVYKGLAVMEGGRELPFTYDQRDFAKLEVADIPEHAAHTRSRFIAWSSLSRSKAVTADFTTFNEVDCVEIVDVPSEDSDRLDPGQKDQSAEI